MWVCSAHPFSYSYSKIITIISTGDLIKQPTTTPFTMRIAVGLILLQEDKVLLLKRHSTGWANGYHAVVAGCLDGDETLTQAIIREAKEEANITLKPEWLSLGTVIHSQITGRSFKEVIDFFFVCTTWEGDIINTEPHKHSDLRFYPLDDLPDSLLDYVKKALELSLKKVPYCEYGWNEQIEIY